jgi:hypothetical protein
MDTALVSTKCRTSDTAMDGIEGDESGLLRAECAELGVEPPADEAVDMMLRLRVGDDAERAVDSHDEEEPTDPWLAGPRRMAISSNHHE